MALIEELQILRMNLFKLHTIGFFLTSVNFALRKKFVPVVQLTIVFFTNQSDDNIGNGDVNVNENYITYLISTG